MSINGSKTSLQLNKQRMKIIIDITDFITLHNLLDQIKSKNASIINVRYSLLQTNV